MNKLITYYGYLTEYLKHGDFRSVWAAIKYLLFKKSHSKDRIIQTSVGKFWCRKNTNDFQFANLHYEWGVKNYMLNHVHEYTVFVDGGACVGEYSILLSRYNLRCFAFEPIQSNYEVLCKNLTLNNLTDKIVTYPCGLGDRNTRANFIYDPINTGASHVSDHSGEGDCISEIRTFDDVFPELDLKKDDRILFKLDVEGMEPQVIKGSTKFIQDFPNITFVMEEKHSGKVKIMDSLNSIASFEFGTVDEYNIFAKKISTKP
ncbi:MAG: FkbM family methyltransferase [Prolixibacteraceae bacterium]